MSKRNNIAGVIIARVNLETNIFYFEIGGHVFAPNFGMDHKDHGVIGIGSGVIASDSTRKRIVESYLYKLD